MLSLDLDGFKAVNDRYGHPGGDALLTSVAERLQSEVSGGDIVARFGGDEFVVLNVAFTSPSEVEDLARRLFERRRGHRRRAPACGTRHIGLAT